MRSVVPLVLVLGLLAVSAGARAEDGQDIELTLAPERVDDARAGDELTLILRIESTFWREVEVELQVEPDEEGDEALQADLAQTRVFLAANASAEVAVSVRVAADATGDHGLRFRAEVDDTSDEANFELRIAEPASDEEEAPDAEEEAPSVEGDDVVEDDAPTAPAEDAPATTDAPAEDVAAADERSSPDPSPDAAPDTLPPAEETSPPALDEAAGPPATPPATQENPPSQPPASDPAPPEPSASDPAPSAPIEVPADAAPPAPLAQPAWRDERIILAAASVATGSLALVAARLARRGGWLAALLAPLYTRIARSRVTEQPTRAQIVEAIRAHPGITFRGLQRELALASGEVTHHTRLLMRAGVVFASQAGQERRFFLVADGYVAPVPSLGDRALAVLARSGPRTSADLARELGVSRPALRYHLVRLEEERRIALTKKGRDVVVALPGAQPASQPPST